MLYALGHDPLLSTPRQGMAVASATTPDGVDERFDPRFFHRAARVVSPLVHCWFRYRLRGLDRLPSGVPALLVGNHSAWGTAEILCFLVAWAETLGESRRVNGLMHDTMLATPLVGAFYRRIGAIPATSDSGHAALSAGHDVLVFPGGDIDSCRPFYEPRKVRFGARRGYVRLALAGLVPNPVRITSEVLPPIDLRAATAHLIGDAAKVEHGHALVYGALVDAVARMEHTRPYTSS